MRDIIDFRPVKFDMLFGSIIEDLTANSTLYTSFIFKRLLRVFKSVADASTDYNISVSSIDHVLCFNFLFKNKDFDFMVVLLSEAKNQVLQQNNFLLNQLTNHSNDFIKRSKIDTSEKIELKKIDTLQSKYPKIYSILASVFSRFDKDINFNDYGFLETVSETQTRIHGMGDHKHTNKDGVSIYYIFDLKNKG